MSTVTIAQLASVLGQAASDAAFRAELLSSPTATLESAGISIPSGAQLRAVADAQNARYLVVPSRPSGISNADVAQLASASLPSGTSVAGQIAAYTQLVAKSWTDSALRAQLLADPAATLAAHGISAPSGVSLSAIESSATSPVVTVPPSGANGIATTVESNFSNLASLITAGSYLAGVAFAASGVLQFKAHGANPTEVPIATPIALLFVAAALTFIPTISR